MIETLWCVEILGPDDIIATESREVAQAMADGFNRWWREREDRHPDEPYMEADVIEWPYDAASHQRKLAAAA